MKLLTLRACRHVHQPKNSFDDCFADCGYDNVRLLRDIDFVPQTMRYPKLPSDL